MLQVAHAGENPAQAETPTDELILVQGPCLGDRSYVSASIPPSAGNELSLRLADAFDQGIPSVVHQRRHRAALVNLHDLRRWVAPAAVVVHAERHQSPDVWILAIDELAVSTHATRFDDALTQLAALVRRRVRSILEDPMGELTARRDLAFRLWVADVDGRLEEVLGEAAALAEDPRGEPPRT